MKDNTKKRPWFQFHLSTAIILMFVAGVFLWLNFSPGELIAPNKLDLPLCNYGWPLPVYGKGLELNSPIHLRAAPLLADFMISLLSLIGVARIQEWRIRRKERQRERP